MVSQEELVKRLDRVRKYESFKKGAKNKSAISDCEEAVATLIGSSVVQLIKKANVYTEQINGEECVSIVSGLLIQDLISNCGCSVEKLPLIIGTVLSMSQQSNRS